MNIKDYIVVSIMAAVYLVCEILKPFLKDKTKWLPLLAGVLGILFNMWLNMGFSFDIFLNGLASGLSATGLNQLIRQTSGYYDEPISDDPAEDDTEEVEEETENG